MSLSIWEVFQSLLAWGESTDEESGEEAEEDRFVPSPLDLSVRVAHGGSDDTVVRELVEVEEQARDLEDAHREN